MIARRAKIMCPPTSTAAMMMRPLLCHPRNITCSNPARATCIPLRRFLSTPPPPPPSPSSPNPPPEERRKPDLYENIYTLPNLLTLSRIASCPLLGYYIVTNQTLPATLTLAYAGVSDLVRRLALFLLKCLGADGLWNTGRRMACKEVRHGQRDGIDPGPGSRQGSHDHFNMHPRCQRLSASSFGCRHSWSRCGLVSLCVLLALHLSPSPRAFLLPHSVWSSVWCILNPSASVCRKHSPASGTLAFLQPKCSQPRCPSTTLSYSSVLWVAPS